MSTETQPQVPVVAVAQTTVFAVEIRNGTGYGLTLAANYSINDGSYEPELPVSIGENQGVRFKAVGTPGMNGHFAYYGPWDNGAQLQISFALDGTSPGGILNLGTILPYAGGTIQTTGSDGQFEIIVSLDPAD